MATKAKSTSRGKAKPKPKPPAPETIELKSATDEASALYRKSDLIADVAARAGVKKREAKPIVDAVLEEMHSRIGQQRTLQVPPLGKLRVTSHKTSGHADIFTLKLRARREDQ